MRSVEDRFLNDPTFHAMVCRLEKAIRDFQLTPSEVREAAMLACVHNEQRRSIEQNWHIAQHAAAKEGKP